MARFDFFARVLSSQGLLGATRVLDVGAGDAWFSSRLVARLGPTAEVVCCDTGYGDASDGEFSGARLRVSATVPDEAFELVLLLDVLEHVQEDAEFLSRIVQRNLAPRGHLLVSVPAWPALFGAHDERLGHHRRYAPREIRDRLSAAGLRLVTGGGLFATLLAPRLLQRIVHRALGTPPRTAGEWQGGPLLTALVRLALNLDGRACGLAARAGLQVPGLSWWGLCARA